MRAARALDMLFVLQRRGRSTAGDLAGLLEVSERTVLRDVEALSEAGIPIFATQGRNGGIELLDGFETHLGGLTETEAQSLFLAGQPQVAHRLGLASPARTVRHKLLQAVRATASNDGARSAERLDSWFVNDPDPWKGHRIAHGELRRLGGCIQRRRRVELILADGPPRLVDPLGLALKAGSWHLVIDDRPEPTVVCVDELRSTRITRASFDAPAGFELAGFWADHVAVVADPA